jgi:hypothetical protein
MCEKNVRKVASFYLRKICETVIRVKICESAHTLGSVVFHGSRREVLPISKLLNPDEHGATVPLSC